MYLLGILESLIVEQAESIGTGGTQKVGDIWGNAPVAFLFMPSPLRKVDLPMKFVCVYWINTGDVSSIICHGSEEGCHLSLSRIL